MTPQPSFRLLTWLALCAACSAPALAQTTAGTTPPPPAPATATGDAPQPWLATLRSQEKALSDAMEKMPPSLGLFSRRGDVRVFLGDFAGAIRDYEEMIALDPSQDAPHWRLGIAYYFEGRYAKAARQFEKYHAFDARDRENGVWKFFSQAMAEGIDKARKEMLEYTRFDREPFPSVYRMLAGQMSAHELLEEVKTKGLQNDRGVVFFAKYYAGWMEFLLGRQKEGLLLVREAVELFAPESAGQNGPGYMWHAARVHAGLLEAAARK